MSELVFDNKLKNNWEKKIYKEACTREVMRGAGWSKMGM
jgi:hypothetical protein